jgi:hypothetical protein
MMRPSVYRDLMSDTPPEPPGAPGDLRRQVEEKVDDLERRLDDVERALAERARLVREGRIWTGEEVPEVSPEKPDPIAD